jgi:hypothetical protein
MRPQLDLPSGRLMLALGAVGLGGAWTGSAGADPAARSAAPRPATSIPPVAPVGAEAPTVLGAAAAPPSPGVPPGQLVLGDDPAPSPAGAPAGRLVLAGLPAASAPLAILGGGARAATTAPEHPHGPAATISVRASRRNLLVGGRLSVFGALRPGAARRAVWLEERRGSGWVTIARGATGPAGGYRLGFTPPAPGTLALRVRAAVQGLGRPVLGALGAVNVYRLAGASWYGPGGSLACGGTLTSGRLGVAHKTLPCGTLVRLHLGHRTVRVPVIDRGPYVSGRDYDLTPATKRALGFGDTGEVWATR